MQLWTLTISLRARPRLHSVGQTTSTDLAGESLCSLAGLPYVQYHLMVLHRKNTIDDTTSVSLRQQQQGSRQSSRDPQSERGRRQSRGCPADLFVRHGTLRGGAPAAFSTAPPRMSLPSVAAMADPPQEFDIRTHWVYAKVSQLAYLWDKHHKKVRRSCGNATAVHPCIRR